MIPIVVRELFVQPVHIIITIRLGQNGCRRDGKILTVAFHNGGMRNIPVFPEAVTVDKQMLRAQLQPVNSAMHGKEGSVQDIYLVNLLGGDNTYRPCQRFFLDDLAQSVALLLGKLLGIVQQIVLEVFGQNNGGGIYGAGKTAASGLIATGFYQFFVQIR